MKIKIEVKRPISIPGDKTRCVDIKAGITEIDESLLDHWFVKSCINKGTIRVITKKPKPNFKSLEQIEKEKKEALSPEVKNLVDSVDDDKVNIGEDNLSDSNKDKQEGEDSKDAAGDKEPDGTEGKGTPEKVKTTRVKKEKKEEAPTIRRTRRG